jgi:hypothetical protein
MFRRSERSYRVLLGIAVVVVASIAAGTAGADSHTPPPLPAPKPAPPAPPAKPAPPAPPAKPAPDGKGSTGPTASQSAPTSPSAPAASATTSIPTTVSVSQLVDTSHQVDDIENKIAQLQARGQSARSGKLAAAATCGFQNPSQVFAPWGDSASYALAPQGDVSTTTGWSFKHTTVAADHDPFTAGTNSLLFAQGDSEAVTPAMCVDLTNPTIRLFMKDTGGNGKSDVKVDVLYEDLNGNIQHLTLAKLRAGSSWSPSITIPIAVNILSAASARGVTAVAFDFKVEGLQKNETLSLDGFYVDPFLAR